MNRRKTVKRKTRFGTLSHKTISGPVELIAYKIARQLYWYRVVHGEEESVSNLYLQVKEWLGMTRERQED
jgi:hypothetical protein